jgi:hypothetical protein
MNTDGLIEELLNLVTGYLLGAPAGLARRRGKVHERHKRQNRTTSAGRRG